MDWTMVGLLLAIAGCFLLANSILFRHPRDLVEEYVGGRVRTLGSIRAYLFHRVQVSIGFLLLLLGFGVQLLGRLGAAPSAGPSVGPSAAPIEFPILWVGAIAALVVVLELAGWWLSRKMFQRYLRLSLIEGKLRLESDSKLTREVGELFGIALRPEDTVRSYAARVRERVDLPERWPLPETIEAREPRMAAEEAQLDTPRT